MFGGPAAIASLVIAGRSYLTSSGPKQSVQACWPPRSKLAPHSRQVSPIAYPNDDQVRRPETRGGAGVKAGTGDWVVTDVMVRPLLICPATWWQQAGVGTSHAAASLCSFRARLRR